MPELRTGVACLLLPFAAACSAGQPAAATGETAVVSIGAVQGPGAASPYADKVVTVEGVVTGDFQDYGTPVHGSLGGYYIASLEPDGDPASSEGLFVFERRRELIDVCTGDVVTVTGVVKEFHGETQLVANDVRVTGTADVEAVDVSLPLDSLEPLEGMLLRFPERLVIAGNRNLGRFGTLTLAAGERPYQFTNVFNPDPDVYLRSRDEYARSTLLLDDGRRDQNPEPVRYASNEIPPRAGNAVSGLTGNLRWSRGSGGDGNEAYRLMPTVEPEFEELNPRPAPPAREGNLRVASFNLLNLFSGLAGGQPVCGPKRDSRCRGAATGGERTRQLAKIVAAFDAMQADVVAIAEIENNARASLDLLTAALAEAGLEYRYVDAGTIGTDSIKVGLLYDPSVVEPLGEYGVLTSSVDRRFIDRLNRPALAQTFRLRANGGTLTVVANHLKSKGSDCNDFGDPNTGDGQGNCNRSRTNAAVALAEWANGGATTASNERVLIVGDLNAYLREDPIRALEAAGYINLLDREHGTSAYSYVFDGRAGALDHALASPTLAPMVIRTTEWHSNADEPRLYDYKLDFGRDPALFDGSSPWRSSDHDPVIVDLELSP